MQEIIRDINEAEARAAALKEEAYKKATLIAEQAEERCAEIAKLCEAECKAYREKALKEAEIGAQKEYEHAITVKRAEAAKYCADKLITTDKVVNEIVRRITRGGC